MRFQGFIVQNKKQQWFSESENNATSDHSAGLLLLNTKIIAVQILNLSKRHNYVYLLLQKKDTLVAIATFVFADATRLDFSKAGYGFILVSGIWWWQGQTQGYLKSLIKTGIRKYVQTTNGTFCLILEASWGHSFLTKDLNVATSLVVAPERWPYVAMWERFKDGGDHDLLTEVNLGQTLTLSEMYDNHLKCGCCCDRHQQASRERWCFIAVHIDSPAPQSVYPSLLAPCRAV